MRIVKLSKFNMRRRAASTIALAALAGPAFGQTPNITVPDANVLTLLSPFLQLPNTAAGQATLTANINAAIATNNAAANSPVIEAVSISDKTIFGGVSTTIVPYNAANPHGTSPTVAYGPGANLGGGLPLQNYQDGTNNGKNVGTAGSTTIPGTVLPYQQYGGYGQLGGAFQAAVQPGGPNTISSVVNLLASAYSFTSNDLGVAKNYFAAGTISAGGPLVIAPSGYNLPSVTAGSGSIYDAYYLSHGYSYNSNLGPNVYGDTRPVQFTSVSGPNINVYDPQAIIGLTTNPAFPSGHTNYGFTDSILLGMLAPQYYQSMLLRGSEYGNSRIGLGVHYPLDIIASRAFASYDLAQLLNATSSSPYYNTNTVGSTSPINGTGLNSSFVTAASQFNSYLANYVATNSGALGCNSVANCAANNPYNTYSAQTYSYQGSSNSAIYDYRQNYGLPTLSFAAAPREQAPAGGPDASILLATLYGGQGNPQAQALANAVTGGTSGAGILANLSTSTINQIIVNTETQALTAFYGTSLSYWSRIDLYDAAGFFTNPNGITSTLKLASADVIGSAGAPLPLTIGNGGAFGGPGTVNGSITFLNGGKFLAVGNPFTSGNPVTSVLPANTPGLVVHGGPVTFQAGSNIQLTAGSVYLPGLQYTLITTDAGKAITVDPSVGVDTSITGNLMTLFTGKLTVSGDPMLLLVLNANFAAAAKSPNQVAVANAIDAVANSGNFNNNGAQLLANLIANNTVATAPAAFNALGGEGITGQQQTALNAGSLFVTTVLGQATFWSEDRRNDIFGFKDGGYKDGASCSLKDGYACAIESRARVWASGVGQYASLDGQNSNGSANVTSRTSGAAGGIDYDATRNLLVGIAGGFTSSTFSVNDRATSGTVDGGQFGVYGRYRNGDFYAAGTVAYSRFDNTENRTIAGVGPAEFASGKFSSDEWLARFEAGYKYGAYNGVSVTPFAGFQVASLSNDAFSENSAVIGGGAGVLGLHVNAQTIDSDRSFVGVQFDTKTNLYGWDLTPYARFSWEHEFSSDRRMTASLLSLPANFTVFGASAADDVARINTGFKLDISRNVAVFGSFDGEFSGRGDSYSGTGGVKIRW